LINLGAWNDDPIVIQAIKEKVVSYLQVAFLLNETEQSFAEPAAD
jgi:hypothetical protein